MLSKELVKQLKQTNLTVDAAKTASRTRTLWEASTRGEKHAVREIAGTVPATIYRVFKKGTLSAKLAAPMAQAFNVNPDYLLGKTDEPGECSDELLTAFLSDLGYGKLLTTRKRRTRKVGTPAVVSEPPVTDTESLEKLCEAPPHEAPPQDTSADADLTYDNMLLLLKALLIKERLGVIGAAEKVSAIKSVLLF